MSSESDKIYSMIDDYIRRMGEVGKKATHVHVTKKQFKALEADFKKNQKDSIFGNAEFNANYKGIPIEIYE